MRFQNSVFELQHGKLVMVEIQKKLHHGAKTLSWHWSAPIVQTGSGPTVTALQEQCIALIVLWNIILNDLKTFKVSTRSSAGHGGVFPCLTMHF